MINNQIFRELSERFAKVVPMAEELHDEARTRIEQVLKRSLQDLDVLTKAEFAAQCQALQRAEQRIMKLEKTLADLESRINATESSS